MPATWEDLLRIADKAVPDFRKAFLQAVAQAQTAAKPTSLAIYLSKKDYAGAATYLDKAWYGASPGWQRDLGTQTLALMAEASTVIDRTVIGGSFDLTNPLAIAWAKGESATLVKYLDTQQATAIRASIRTIIGQTVEGLGTYQTAARAITKVVGLDPRRAAALARYRAILLEQAKAQSIGLSAAKAGKVLAKAENKADRYARKLLYARAETIARTETLAASNQGLVEAWTQAQRDGRISRDLVMRWVTTPDDRRCPYCRAMHGQLARLGAKFVSGKYGGIARPPLHPNCRCVLTLVRPKKGQAVLGSAASPAKVTPLRTYTKKPKVPAKTAEMMAEEMRAAAVAAEKAAIAAKHGGLVAEFGGGSLAEEAAAFVETIEGDVLDGPMLARAGDMWHSFASETSAADPEVLAWRTKMALHPRIDASPAGRDIVYVIAKKELYAEAAAKADDLLKDVGAIVKAVERDDAFGATVTRIARSGLTPEERDAIAFAKPFLQPVTYKDTATKLDQLLAFDKIAGDARTPLAREQAALARFRDLDIGADRRKVAYEEYAQLRTARETALADDLLSRAPFAPASGSNPGGWYKAADGGEYYVKFYPDALQAESEALAHAVYRQVGHGAPEAFVGRTSAGRLVHVSRKVAGVRGEVGKLGLTPATADQILDGFLTDVLTANWDAVGSGLNNVVLDTAGKVHRIDGGGTFFYRAKAGLKPDAALREITEFEGFLKKNPDYARVFRDAGKTTVADIGEDRLRAQLARIDDEFGNPLKMLAFVQEHLPAADAATHARFASVFNARLSKLRVAVETEIDRVGLAAAERLAAEIADREALALAAERRAARAASGATGDRFTAAEADAIINPRIGPTVTGAADRAMATFYGRDLAKVEARLQAAIDAAKACLNIKPASFEKVLSDGRFKNLFEVGTGGGCTDQSYRSRMEQVIFGLPAKGERGFKAANRPIYGNMQSNPGDSSSTQYGNITVVFKDSVRQRATATKSDSFGSHSGGMMPARLTDMKARALGAETHYKAKTSTRIEDWQSSYFEVQYHGGMSVEDIEEVVFGGPPPKKIEELLKAQGIPWRIHAPAGSR